MAATDRTPDTLPAACVLAGFVLPARRAGPRGPAPEYDELLPQGRDLEQEIGSRPEHVTGDLKEGAEDGEHVGRASYPISGAPAMAGRMAL